MSRVIFVLGLCGSGKSTRARELAAGGFADFDEKATGRSLRPDWPNSAYLDLVDAVATGRDCVATDIWFFEPEAQQRVTRDLAQAHPDVVIEWECFDPADLELANHNCRHDPTRTPVGIEGNLRQNDYMVQCLHDGTFQLPARTRLLRTVSV
jgi:hypothetical protein